MICYSAGYACMNWRYFLGFLTRDVKEIGSKCFFSFAFEGEVKIEKRDEKQEILARKICRDGNPAWLSAIGIQLMK